MDSCSLISQEKSWWIFTLSPILQSQNLSTTLLALSLFGVFFVSGLISWALSTGGSAWINGRRHKGLVSIPGPKGLPIFGSLFSLSHGLAHRTLACLASSCNAKQLMAFSLGSTPVVVASDPQTAREILTSPHFASRPIKESAKQLMFSRAIGFAPSGAYWRLLRRISTSHLFAPKLISAHEKSRQLECNSMIGAIYKEQNFQGHVELRKHLQTASLNNIMEIVFGKKYETAEDAKELHEVVREGFELLGAFNWSDYLPWLSYFYDPLCINQRCSILVPRVKKLVKRIIHEHQDGKARNPSCISNFVDVLLCLEGEEKLDTDDMIAVLWEMIFRGTDTTALLTEWIMAELVLHQDIQAKIHNELKLKLGTKNVTDADIIELPYLQAVLKETLRVHPPGPLLSWARLSTADVQLSNGMVVPVNTVAMVNMWSITHDPTIWAQPWTFLPDRFLISNGGVNFDVRGNDLRLAPFGAGRRVCPGKNLGLATVSLWVAKLVQNFRVIEKEGQPVELEEVLKLSSEMKNPLSVVVIPRSDAFHNA